MRYTYLSYEYRGKNIQLVKKIGPYKSSGVPSYYLCSNYCNFEGMKVAPYKMLAHLALVITQIAQSAAGRPPSQHNHSFVATSAHDLLLSGGASVTRNPLNCLRSGSPNQHSSAAFVLPLSPGVFLTTISFNYRYTVGWGAPAPGKGTNFSLRAGASSHALYSSPAYNDYPYSKAHPNYSSPVMVHAAVSESIPASGPTRL